MTIGAHTPQIDLRLSNTARRFENDRVQIISATNSTRKRFDIARKSGLSTTGTLRP